MPKELFLYVILSPKFLDIVDVIVDSVNKDLTEYDQSLIHILTAKAFDDWGVTLDTDRMQSKF